MHAEWKHSNGERSFTIRRAAKGDADALFEIGKRAFKSEAVAQKIAAAVEDYGSDSSAVSLDFKSASIVSRYLVCHEDSTGSVVGMVGNYKLRWIGDQNAYLGWFFVDPDMQRHGIGRALIGATVEVLEGEGCKYLLVETAPTPVETIQFYVTAGFEFVARVEDYWEDSEALILMRRKLYAT